MERCNTCPHWRLNEAEQNHYLTYRNPEPERLTGRCVLLESTSGMADVEGAPAVAMDFESYGAQLFTAPDFGCVAHPGNAAKGS